MSFSPFGSKLAKYLGYNQIETLADHDEASVVEFFNRPWWWQAASSHQFFL